MDVGDPQVGDAVEDLVNPELGWTITEVTEDNVVMEMYPRLTIPRKELKPADYMAGCSFSGWTMLWKIDPMSEAWAHYDDLVWISIRAQEERDKAT